MVRPVNVRVRIFVAGVVVAAALAVAPTAGARDVIIPSFDGAPISASFFPAQGLAPGQKAPTILETHGWGAVRDKDENSSTLAPFGQVGLGPLRRAGFNVLTWDSRGFGESGGTVEVDSKDFEGRDVSALLAWLATQPEQQLDAPGDPRAGMTGASYAGGIELVAAGIDHRIDAIAPSIAWHSLLTALYRDDLVKGGWAAALSGLGIPTATALGIISPAGIQTGTVDPHITSALAEGLATGHLSDEDRAWFQSRGPGDALVSQIRVPTLLVQGTADTLFTPSEAMRNFELLKASGVPGAHAVVLRRARRVPDAGRQQPRRGPHRGVAAALADGRPRRRLRSDLRVAGRRRPVAQRARLAAGAGPGHDGPGLGHADLQPCRHGVLGPRRGGDAVA